MSEQELNDKIASIANGQPCAITLTNTQGEEFLCKGKFSKRQDCQFALDFSYGDIPLNIDLKQVCPFSTTPETGRITISCSTKIVSHKGMTIEFMALEPTDPSSLRNFFRVNIRTAISVTHRPELQGRSDLYWSISGQTVDISRSGVLAILSAECPHFHPLTIEIDLPDPKFKCKCVGHIVHIRRLTRSRWLTSFHFDEFDDTTADTLTGNCLTEQRKQIRTNVETSG